MRRKAARLIFTIYVAALLCSCHAETEIKTEVQQTDNIKEAEPITNYSPVTFDSLPYRYEESKQTEEESVEIEEVKEPVTYQVMDVMEMVKAESEVSKDAEDRKPLLLEVDLPPTDTVEYIASDEEEIMETRKVESIVDENDPTTYQIIEKEQEVSILEEIPEEYINGSGQVKYTFQDGSWYEYRYSTGDLTLDEQDEELALMLLNLDGFYDGYEVVSIECEELSEDSGAQFAYHVLYQKKIVMEEPPLDVENLTVSKSQQKTTLQSETIEEKVPILLKEEYGTGEYTYYGWQELDENIYYFDPNGDRVTGSQVIRGIRYMFDADGIRTSRTGIMVSSQNEVIDWEAVHSAGIDFAIIRCAYRGCTDGALILDSKCTENITNARNVGIEVRISLFSQAITEQEAVEEASLIAALADQYEITTPLVIESACANSGYSGRADGLSTHDRTICVKAFCQTLQSAGYTPMIHAEKGWIENNLEWDILSAYPLLLTQYNSNVTYTDPYEFWNYTAKGTVDGISGNISLIISYGK